MKEKKGNFFILQRMCLLKVVGWISGKDLNGLPHINEKPIKQGNDVQTYSNYYILWQNNTEKLKGSNHIHTNRHRF